MSHNGLALKPFLEAIEQYCQRLSPQELTATIINIAKELSAGERNAFLAKLYAALPDVSKRPDHKERDEMATIFYAIAALQENIEERQESIDDGSYWDRLDYENGYDEEEPDSIAAEQLSELCSFFAKADRYFLDGNLECARDIYQRLFELLQEWDEFDVGVLHSSEGFNLREVHARYCRCAYEISPPKKRVREVLAAIKINGTITESILQLEKEMYPMLQDVIDAKTGDLANWDDFLANWEVALQPERSNRARTLLLEAAFLRRGLDGVATLARQWGASQPRGYLTWIQHLVAAADWPKVAEICREALPILPHDSFHAQAAGYLIQAGQHSHDPALVREGKRERFMADPTVANLGSLVRKAGQENVREQELATLLEFLRQPQSAAIRKEALYTQALLMAGEVRAAFDDAQKERCIGWSHGKGGLVFGGILFILSDGSVQAKTIRDLIKFYSKIGSSAYSWSGGLGTDSTIHDEIVKGLMQFQATAADRQNFWDWAERLGRERIDHIVGHKHRNAYARAAMVLGALTESLVLCNQPGKAQQLVHEFYGDRYKHYPSFRSEVKSVFGASILLKKISL